MKSPNKVINILFCFVFTKEVKYFFWKMKISQKHLSKSNISISEWHLSNCLYSALALASFSQPGDSPIFCFPLGSLCELVLERSKASDRELQGKQEINIWLKNCFGLYKLEWSWNWLCSRIAKSSVMFSRYWTGSEPAVHSSHCHTYRFYFSFHLSLYCICIQTNRN